MKVWKTKYRRLIILLILLAFTVIPFLDSMACDDLTRSSSSSGSRLEIRCKDFAQQISPHRRATQNQMVSPLRRVGFMFYVLYASRLQDRPLFMTLMLSF